MLSRLARHAQSYFSFLQLLVVFQREIRFTDLIRLIAIKVKLPSRFLNYRKNQESVVGAERQAVRGDLRSILKQCQEWRGKRRRHHNISAIFGKILINKNPYGQIRVHQILYYSFHFISFIDCLLLLSSSLNIRHKFVFCNGNPSTMFDKHIRVPIISTCVFNASDIERRQQGPTYTEIVVETVDICIDNPLSTTSQRSPKHDCFVEKE